MKINTKEMPSKQPRPDEIQETQVVPTQPPLTSAPSPTWMVSDWFTWKRADSVVPLNDDNIDSGSRDERSNRFLYPYTPKQLQDMGRKPSSRRNSKRGGRNKKTPLRARNAKNVPVSESWAEEDLELLRLGVQRFAESLGADAKSQEEDTLSKWATSK